MSKVVRPSFRFLSFGQASNGATAEPIQRSHTHSAATRISLSTKHIALLFALIILGFFSLSFASDVVKFAWGHDHQLGMRRFVHVGQEQNIPTWYSSMALFCAAGLLAAIALIQWRRKDPFRFHWGFLALVFLLISIDEISWGHETLSRALEATIRPSGFFHFAWVIPALIFLAVMGLFYLRFLLSLPPRTKWCFAGAGLVFVAGALGVEMLEGYQHTQYGSNTIGMAVLVLIEESMEMVGVAIFICALLDYLKQIAGRLEINFGAEKSDTLSTSNGIFSNRIETPGARLQ